jgi:hypothetical protein
MNITRRTFMAAIGAGAAARVCRSQTAIATDHYDTLRSGWNGAETRITLANVGSLTRKGTYTVSGYQYAQPMLIPGVPINGVRRNVLLAVTQSGNVYEFDSDVPGSAAIATLALTAPRTDFFGAIATAGLYVNSVACISTPAIDPVNFVAWIIGANTQNLWWLYKIDLTTLTVISKVSIHATVTGTGDSTSSDPSHTETATTTPSRPVCGTTCLDFNPYMQSQRTALTYYNGSIYFGAAAWTIDPRPFHGWFFRYNATTLAQQAVLCTTPDGWGGGIFQGGKGVAIDPVSGDLILATGNGSWNGTTNFSNSLLRLDKDTLAIKQFFTPTDWDSLLNTNDLDLDANGPGLVLTGGNRLATWATKCRRVYSVNIDHMGGLGGTGDGFTPQIFDTNGGGKGNSGGGVGSYNSIYNQYTGALYANDCDCITSPFRAYVVSRTTLSGSTWDTNWTYSQSGNVAYWPGAAISGSSNGASNSIIWAVYPQADAHSPAAGTLVAIDGITLATLFTDSSIGTMTKYAAPLVVDGRVFVALKDAIHVYAPPSPGVQFVGPVLVVR